MFVNFRVAMMARQLNQTELAERAHMDYTVLSHVIHGRRKASPDVRAKLARVLQVKEAWLFDRRPATVGLPRAAGRLECEAY